ncbi:MAG: HAD-IA family hydrolase [Cyanobacteria bacterium J06598_1]
MPQTQPQITHLIYDFDGLLLNTEPIYCEVNRIIASRYGKTFTPEIHQKIMGRQALDCAQILVRELDLPLSAQEHLAARNEIIFDLLPQAKPMPGAMEMTRRFYQAGVPQAIATSSASVTFYKKVLHYSDWLKCFEVIVLGDDAAVKQSKPAPDSFVVAAQRLGANPAHCLVLEDAPAGIKGAKAAGMWAVAVPAAHMERALYVEADEIIERLPDFDPQHWQLAV